MTDLVFVRHGQTHGNATGTWQGWRDPSLNSTGHAQARAVAHRLAVEKGQIEALYTSPLRRAYQTAEAIGARLNLHPEVLDQLKEIHFGKLEGYSLAEMENQFPDLYARWQEKEDMTFQWPGGERRADFFGRAADVCDRLRALHEGDEIVIVSHGGTIRACLAHLLPRQLGQWWTYALDNAGLSRVRAADRRAEVLALNDTTHLPDDGSSINLEQTS